MTEEETTHTARKRLTVHNPTTPGEQRQLNRVPIEAWIADEQVNADGTVTYEFEWPTHA